MDFYGGDQFNEQNSQGNNNGYYQNQQGYGNGYYQNQQQGYGNGYYQNQQQGYGNGYYQNQQGYGNGYYQNQQQGYGNGYYQNQQQGYGNGYYQNQQQGYGNGNYQNTQQQQYYNNTGYQNPMMDGEFHQPDFSNQPFNRREFYKETIRKARERGDGSTVKIEGGSGVAFLIWFIASIVIGVGLSFLTGHPGWIMVSFGQLFAGAGIMVFAKEKRKLENAIILIFPIAGIALAVAGLIMLFGTESLLEKLSEYAPFLFLSVFFIVGFLLAVITPINLMMKKKRCIDAVKGVVVDLIRSRSSRGSGTYTPVYEYYYKGHTYREKDSFGSNVGVPHVGQEVDVFVNPDDPTDYYVGLKSRYIVPMVFGIIFMLFPAFIAFSMLQ